MSVAKYMKATPEELMNRLAELTDLIISTLSDLSFSKQSELQAKLEGWNNSQETSVTGREKTAAYSALNVTTTILDLEAQLAMAREEKFFILRLLDA